MYIGVMLRTSEIPFNDRRKGKNVSFQSGWRGNKKDCLCIGVTLRTSVILFNDRRKE